jgi:hypothetical protein
MRLSRHVTSVVPGLHNLLPACGEQTGNVQTRLRRHAHPQRLLTMPYPPTALVHTLPTHAVGENRTALEQNRQRQQLNC